MASNRKFVTNFVRIVILVALSVLFITLHHFLNSNISLRGEALSQRTEQRISSRINFKNRNEQISNGSSTERKSGVYGLDTKTNLVIHDKSGRFYTLQEYQTIPTNVILNKDSDIIFQWWSMRK